MRDAANDLVPPTWSPSASSSDLDTESTGSFFHDRSTTLGTLMGVSFPAITLSQHQHSQNHASKPNGNNNNKNRNPTSSSVDDRRLRRWWRLCRDAGPKPASLGEFLEVERRFGDCAFYGGGVAAEPDGVMVSRQQPRDGRLFSNGRVLPPADVDEGTSTAVLLCRFPVSLTRICSGGVG
ncbi:hypothetical protein CFOL_v3_16910 [Cephalotus follicularis]|uniref:Uncharacterized protein n=1 Tax=Cephalotus follicularis TaxID=3775 RepID=A0A1Q3BZH8_CEPFO|nr:hypothetical protein CFOL_v3_16910 [Cephalotus follicularis]